MSGRPERMHPKRPVHFFLNEDIDTGIKNLLLKSFKSYSQLVELLLFWSKNLHIEMHKEKLIHYLCMAKGAYLSNLSHKTEFPQKKRIHLTIDKSALQFLQRYYQQYMLFFTNTSDVLESIMLYAWMECQRTSTASMQRRLAEIQRINPSLY